MSQQTHHHTTSHPPTQQQKKNAEGSGCCGCMVGIVAYLILVPIASPQVNLPLWGALAFLVIPSVIGFTVGRMIGLHRRPNERFWRALRACFGAMFAYTLINLIWRRSQFNMNGNEGQLLLVWTLIPMLYASIAGIVAGFVSAKLATIGLEVKKR